ncbi:MAG TPA: tRNA pseudouridine(38-40) synthase TruA [Microbacteriaceae bacterium]|nr:tRNA pseudouridine(38-40) synthase TruA [Microbacteriaceae bacterium]
MGEPTRVRLGIAYDGTNFAGWAKQPGLRTVQGELEAALERLFQRVDAEPLQLTVAGRTDAGVHATGQVAHIDLAPAHADALMVPKRGHDSADADAAAALRRRMSGILGSDADVLVTGSEIVSAEFDARFSAVWRRYRYRIADALTPPNPIRRFDTVSVPVTLDVEAMHEAAQTVLGLRDFATFCKARPDATTIRELQHFAWSRDEDGVVVAELQADAFCHSMVRALVGGCVAAGSARFAPDCLGELQAAAERTSAFAVMPAHGLTLVKVGYPDPAEWGSRAEAIRAKRSADELGLA